MRIFLLFAILAAGCSLNEEKIILHVKERLIDVDGKEASVFCIEQPDGTPGFTAQKGQLLAIQLENYLDVPTSVHWHGLLLPNDQDGVAFVTQYPIYPGKTYGYHFPLMQAGTFWMHAHFELQEQKLLSAPLILKEASDTAIADQEAVLFLTDFSFKNPEQIFAELRCPSKIETHTARMHDIVEVAYDAFLTNCRTLSAPEIVPVLAESIVRLRIINGSSATNFFLSLGALKGTAIAIDGNRIEPIEGSSFELAVAQRIDILVTIPATGGAFPILAQGEGTAMQTGLVLASSESLKSLAPISQRASVTAGRFTNRQESLFHPLTSLNPRPVDRKIALELEGDMAAYVWTINKQAWPNITPILVKKGERIEITFKNTSTMAHPMHLHGHTFQVTALNGKPLQGPMRDTVLVPVNETVTIQFDADSPGVWPLHCHVLYHLVGGMMTVIRYEGYTQH